MRFIDLFCGVGGFHEGLKRANSNKSFSEKRRSKERRNRNFEKQGTRFHNRQHSSFSCVWANEWDKYAGEVYKKRFPETKFSGEDIRTVNADRIPDFDLLCGGFPCQAFSIAGKRKGFDETRGTLFFEIARIIKAKRPRLVLLENVKGLLSHDKGRTFGTIISTLDELGYWVEWQVLNSKDFSVPQNRERVFIVGHLRGTSSRKIFPLTESDFGNVEKREDNEGQENIAWALRTRDYKDGTNFVNEGVGLNQIGNVDTKGHNSLWGRVYNPKGLAANLNAKGGGLGAKTGLYDVSAVLTPDRENKRQNGRRFKENGEPMFTLTNQDIHGVQIAPALGANNLKKNYSGQNKSFFEKTGMIRRLTPRECERLQGFPDDFTLIKMQNGKVMSDSQRYKMMGNAVTVNVIQAIGEKLKEGNCF